MDAGGLNGSEIDVFRFHFVFGSACFFVFSILRRFFVSFLKSHYFRRQFFFRRLQYMVQPTPQIRTLIFVALVNLSKGRPYHPLVFVVALI